MTTQLTDIGWSGPFGSGTWTNRADIVDSGDEIIIASGVTVNSLGSEDIITGTGFLGIFNIGTLNTDNGKDRITGIATGDGAVGLFNQGGTLNTGNGKDTITGIATGPGTVGVFNNGGIINTDNGEDLITGDGGVVGVFNQSGTIDTGNGDDTITGTGLAGGISNQQKGVINTSSGNDLITATATTGGEFGFGNAIVNQTGSTIDTGDGNDIISGISTIVSSIASVGILNGTGNDVDTITTGNGDDIIIGSGMTSGIRNYSIIDTGKGSDTVDALAGGFDGGGSIYLGKGNDLIQGFGSQNVDGGKGFDTAELGIDYNQSLLFVGSSFDIQIGNMNFTNVEQFVFSNGDTFSLQNLQAQVQI